ncbi:hypothetical protein [Siphonobacter sp. SORGH_AS_0500]|uniref:hypothetical protein n=1 Tax=Siphonobacter sp. SORGH_AS_0500 TaxID=1864824 RepID=UPI0028587FC6|nr:hypothetical protein [Siphonobacter sp. SORGH_AS_0500]MDR6194751.1 hypothetical protein [Siphonobacter sp. SORGH_AS_0500]
MIRTKSSRSAVKSHPEQSLFKFSLSFHPTSQEALRKQGKPWIWYSFDLPEERALFLPALPQTLRSQWLDFLSRLFKYEDLYLFFRDCYPQEEDQRLIIYFATVRAPEIRSLSVSYGEYVSRCLAQMGFSDFTLRHQIDPVQIPGKCPSRLERDFYGIRAFETNPKVVQWLSSQTLLSVKIYDNRCYHPENEYGVIQAPPQQASKENEGRIIENAFRKAV